ncbi:hypothetical protein K1719_002245 [Acacia pycnantha]|nr:hypothetical protein K1719_002245 [Acacia pycnantha]
MGKEEISLDRNLGSLELKKRESRCRDFEHILLTSLLLLLWPQARSFAYGSHERNSALCSSGTSNAEGARGILVQHLLVKEDDQKLLLDLQQRISSDLSDLALEYSLCPFKEGGGMLGWVKRGEMKTYQQFLAAKELKKQS